MGRYFLSTQSITLYLQCGQEIPNIPNEYIINVISEDGWNNTFTKNETQGFVEVYNSYGELITNNDVTMIIAYKENNMYYSKIDPEKNVGPLRIAFIGNDVITSSNLWAKMVVTIEVI